MGFFRGVLWVAAAAALYAEQPVGLILKDSDGLIRRPGIESPLNIRSGVALFARDSLEGGAQPVEFAYCPSKQEVTLAPRAKVRIDTQRAPAGAGKSLVVCELPGMSPFPLADTSRRAPHPADPGSPGVAAIDGGLPKPGEEADILIHVARAVRLQNAKLPEEAMVEYDFIHLAFPDANWTDEVSGNLARHTDGARGTIPNPPKDWAPKKTYALLVGISKYDPRGHVPWLRFADADADLFKKYLKSPRGGGLKKCKTDKEIAEGVCEIVEFKNEQATLASITGAFKPGAFVAKHASPDNQLIIFIAAHGFGPASSSDRKDDRIIEANGKPVLNPEPVIVTYDGEMSDLKVTGLPMRQLHQDAAIAARTYGRVLVYVDVCRAGYVDRVQESPEMHDATEKAFAFNERTGVLMASDESNNAFEFEELGGHGAFSYFAVAGLNTTSPASGKLEIGKLRARIEHDIDVFTKSPQYPTDYAKDHRLPVVDDLSKEGSTVPERKEIVGLTPPRGRGAPMPQGTKELPPPTRKDDPDPLRGGRLRKEEADSAWAEWESLKNAGDFAAADEYAGRLRVALEDRGQQVILKYLRGDQEKMSDQEFVEGAKDFEASLALVPSNPFTESRALFCRGRALVFSARDADFDQAVNLLQRSIRMDGSRGYAYNALGIAYLEHAGSDTSRLHLAERAFHDAIHFAPYWPYPWHNLALAATELGDYSGAIQDYQHAIKLAPRYPYLPYNLGLLYQRINRPKDAQLQYQAARKIAADSTRDLILIHTDGRKPEEAEALNALGTLAEVKDTKTARGEYEEAIAYDSKIVSARHNLAVLISKTDKQSTQPEDLWKQVLSLKPGSETTLLAYAQYLADHDRLEEARERYTELVAHVGQFDEAHRNLGKVLASLHRPEDALAQYQLAKNLAPDDAQTLEGLGEEFRKSGRNALAHQCYEMALRSLGPHPNRKERGQLQAKLRSALQ